MKFWSKLLFLGVLVSAVAACGTATKDPEGGSSDSSSSADSGSRGSVQPQGGIQGSALDDPNSPLSTRTVYFSFDSSEVKAADRDTIMAHAQYLASNPGTKIVLEGHADERGTREYNIALGERRAKAVSQLMLLQGAAQSQIDIVSFGEERPAATGHDESAWSQNRRVEILYQGN